jgi:drug/metabolite transporter (DMT)-like permease
LFLFAFCYVFPFGFGELKRVAFFDMPQEALFSVAFVVIGTTYFAYLMNNYALQKVGPAVVSIYIYLQPLIAAAIAILTGKDALESTKIISAALIFTGLYLVSSSAKKIPAK